MTEMLLFSFFSEKLVTDNFKGISACLANRGVRMAALI
jgi:hypothetical protein